MRFVQRSVLRGGVMVRCKRRSNNLRQVILDILRREGRPMTSTDISYAVETETRFRANTWSVSAVIIPLISEGLIRKVHIKGLSSPAYETVPLIQIGHSDESTP